jgi:hypothetical protein
MPPCERWSSHRRMCCSIGDSGVVLSLTSSSSLEPVTNTLLAAELAAVAFAESTPPPSCSAFHNLVPPRPCPPASCTTSRRTPTRQPAATQTDGPTPPSRTDPTSHPRRAVQTQRRRPRTTAPQADWPRLAPDTAAGMPVPEPRERHLPDGVLPRRLRERRLRPCCFSARGAIGCTRRRPILPR